MNPELNDREQRCSQGGQEIITGSSTERGCSSVAWGWGCGSNLAFLLFFTKSVISLHNVELSYRIHLDGFTEMDPPCMKQPASGYTSC